MGARSRVAKLTAGVVLVGALAACTDGGSGAPTTTPGTASSVPTTAGPGPSGPGGGSAAAFSGIRLSKGSAPGAAASPTAVVAGTPLDDDQVAAVLGQLPAWTPPAADAYETGDTGHARIWLIENEG